MLRFWCAILNFRKWLLWVDSFPSAFRKETAKAALLWDAVHSAAQHKKDLIITALRTAAADSIGQLRAITQVIGTAAHWRSFKGRPPRFSANVDADRPALLRAKRETPSRARIPRPSLNNPGGSLAVP
jgi:hypothetical protein